MKKKIILVEDEESLSKIITLNLEMEGFEVTAIKNGQQAINLASKIKNYDLVILDVMLPSVSGWDICKAYKEEAHTPILFISAKGTSTDKIKGLKLGADDYLVKPFDLEELLLRVQILTQRVISPKIKREILEIGDFSINLRTYEVKKGNEYKVELTKREIDFYNRKRNKMIIFKKQIKFVWFTIQHSNW